MCARRASAMSDGPVTQLTSSVLWALRLPRLPFARGLWRVVDGKSGRVADRAVAVLGLVKPSGGVVDRQDRFAPSPGPVVVQGGVVRGRHAGRQGVG